MKTSKLILAALVISGMTSCAEKKTEETLVNEDVTVAKQIANGDFKNGYLPVVAHTSGIKQEVMATPKFMKERFKKIEMTAPDSVLITYWTDKDLKINGVMGVAQFLFQPCTNPKEKMILACNEKTKSDYFEKYRDGVVNPVIAYYDMNEDKISFDEQYGDVRESTQFVFLGNEILKIHRTGTNVTDYDLVLNKTKLRRGTAEYKNANNYKDSLVLLLAAN